MNLPNGSFSEIELAGGSGAAGATIYNNAVTGVVPVSVSGSFGGIIGMDDNFYDTLAAEWLWEGVSYGTLGDWQTTGMDAASGTGNPLFTDPSRNDFRPASGSPLLDSGSAAQCAWFPLGAGCDVGAFEMPVGLSAVSSADPDANAGAATSSQ